MIIRNNAGGEFYRAVPTDLTALHPTSSYQTTFNRSKVDHLLLPNFFHQKTNGNFVRKLKFARRIDPQPNIFNKKYRKDTLPLQIRIVDKCTYYLSR